MLWTHSEATPHSIVIIVIAFFMLTSLVLFFFQLVHSELKSASAPGYSNINWILISRQWEWKWRGVEQRWDKKNNNTDTCWVSGHAWEMSKGVLRCICLVVAFWWKRKHSLWLPRPLTGRPSLLWLPVCYSTRMPGWLSWRPAWKLCACWRFRRGPGRRRNSCRTLFTSTWDRYAGTALSASTHPRRRDVWPEDCCRTDPEGSRGGGRSQDTRSTTVCSLWGCGAANCSECPHWPLSAVKNAFHIQTTAWKEVWISDVWSDESLSPSCGQLCIWLSARPAIVPDWRAGGGNVRLSAIFSWWIGSCC